MGLTHRLKLTVNFVLSAIKLNPLALFISRNEDGDDRMPMTG